MTADVDTAGTAASPVSPSSRRAAAASQNGAVPVDLHELQQALEAMRAGDFSVRLPTGRAGAIGRISVLFNEIVGANQVMAQQLERIGKSVGEQGRTRQRVKFALSTAAWGEMEGSVNGLIDDLVWPTTEVTRVIGAVAQGDLLQTVRLDVDGRPLKGEFLRSATIVNTMIKQLSVFTSEVTRVAREVGTEGKLGGQAKVSEVTGVWRELTESVNSMANNLTAQVRNISDVTIAVANGDLSRKITVDVARRDPAAQGSHQHHGGPAAVLRLGSDARGARGRHRGQAGRPGDRARRRRHLEGPDQFGERHVRQPHRPGAQHRRRDHRRGARRLVQEDHRRRARRDPAAQGHHQHHGGPAERLRRRGDPRGPRGRHRGQARRPGPGARRGRHLEGPHRQRQLDGDQPHGPGAQHRRGDHRRGDGRPVEEDHRRRARRDPAAEGDHQHDGRSAERLRRRGDPRGPRGRHRGQARRPGPGAGRRRHVEGPDRQRQPAGGEPHHPGPQHRRGHDRRGRRRPLQEDHRRRLGRDPAAEGDHQHDGRSAERLRRRGDARGPRGRHRRQARRPGAGARRRRHLEGPHRQRQLHGHQPHRPGAQHRRGDDRRGQRRPVQEDHRRRARRDPAAERDHQHHGRSAERLRRRGDPRGPRGRHRGQAGRPGAGARRRRRVEGPHRQRQPAGGQPHHPGPQHRRGDDRRGDAATCPRRSPSTCAARSCS